MTNGKTMETNELSDDNLDKVAGGYSTKGGPGASTSLSFSTEELKILKSNGYNLGNVGDKIGIGLVAKRLRCEKEEVKNKLGTMGIYRWQKE